MTSVDQMMLAECMPIDKDAVLVGRLALSHGPTPVIVRGGEIVDVSEAAATVADLLDRDDIFSISGNRVCDVANVCGPLAAEAGRPAILSPVDLQCVKAAGVTFALSAIERVIEEKARGDARAATEIRGSLEQMIGDGLRSVVPGSAAAERLKAALIDAGMWSQYLEVAIGPDAEIFTKSPVLSTVGWGAEIGVRSDSSWNNPEPEIVLVVDSRGRCVGATLGNDVNLRDFEGRSALLLGKAKDNNGSCALGPFVRLFDDSFTMDDVRAAEIRLEIAGTDDYRLAGESSMRHISRDPEELVRQTLSEHQYPDGFVLFLGTSYAPIQDRDEPGRGFTHKPGDMVSIGSPRLGRLTNRVTFSNEAEPWVFGIRSLYGNLYNRRLMGQAQSTYR